MGLSRFVAREPRALPIFVLADRSGSMSGEKINELNLSLREMLTALNNMDDIRGKFQLSIISFGTDKESGEDVAMVEQELSDLGDVELVELDPYGRTPMGAAFELVSEIIEDREIVSSRAYAPTIVLVSDGIPTDCDVNDYLEWDSLRKLHSGERTSKCQRLALGIGEDADADMLKAFVNNEEIPVIKTKDASGITKFFKWVTMSTVARMNSVNPDVITTVAPTFDIDDEDIVI